MAAVIASSLGQANFISYFGLATAPNASQLIGAMVSCANIGGIIGVVTTGWISDRYGRKASYWYNCVWYLLGIGLEVGSRNTAMFCVARLFLGMGGWANLMSGINYAAELATPARRGILGGLMGVALTAGYVTAGWVTVGFYFYDASFNWRAPLLIQLFYPIAIVGGSFFVPESPRWLALQGREDEVLNLLKSIHHSVDDPDYIVAREESFQIVEQAKIDRTLPSSWYVMVTKYWKRTLVSVIILAGNQSTGIQFCTNYNVVTFISLGYTGVLPFVVQACWLVAALVFDIFWASMLDRVGRRPFIIASPLLCCCVMAIITALYKEYFVIQDPAGLKAITAMIFVFLFVFSMEEPAQFAYIGEIFPSHVRTKGIAAGIISFLVTGVWLTMSAPTGVAVIGWKYFLIFVVLGLFYFIVQLPLVKETKGLPLEEVGLLFGDGDVAIRHSDIVLDREGGISTMKD